MSGHPAILGSPCQRNRTTGVPLALCVYLRARLPLVGRPMPNLLQLSPPPRAPRVFIPHWKRVCAIEAIADRDSLPTRPCRMLLAGCEPGTLRARSASVAMSYRGQH